jgi:hypothetical protein
MALTMVLVDESVQNRDYVRRLLKQKQPLFAAALELAVALAERELVESAQCCASPVALQVGISRMLSRADFGASQSA